MNQPPPEEFYRQLHTGTPGDVEFYSRLIGESDRVLELGCGWGRMAAALAPLCKAITGVDSNGDFCVEATRTLAKYPQAQIVHCDIRNHPSLNSQSSNAGPYDRIIAPYNFLYALGGQAGVADTLRFVREHLALGGEFWADIYPMDAAQAALEGGEESPPDDDEPVGELKWENRLYPILETSTLDGKIQRLEVTYRAVEPMAFDATIATSTIVHDYLLLDQLERLIDDAGLEIALLLGSFEGASYDDEAEQLVLCARRRTYP